MLVNWLKASQPSQMPTALDRPSLLIPKKEATLLGVGAARELICIAQPGS